MTLSDYLTSVIRTAVPAVWGTALAWLVSVGVLDQAAAAGPGAAAGGFLVTVFIGAYYVVVRLLEPHLPPFLAVLLLGASKAPAYGSSPAPAGAGAGLEVDDDGRHAA